MMHSTPTTGASTSTPVQHRPSPSSTASNIVTEERTSALSPQLAKEIGSGTEIMPLTSMRQRDPAGKVAVSMPGPDVTELALNDRIVERAANFQKTREPNRDAALQFYKGLADLEGLSGKDRERHLQQLCNHLVRALGYAPAEVKALERTAGRWSNMQNIVPDTLGMVPQLVGAFMLLRDVSALTRASTTFALAGMATVGTPLLGTYYIQPMLEIQRLTRPLTSVNYGKAANPTPAYEEMSLQAGETSRLIAQAEQPESAVTPQELTTQRTALEKAHTDYVNAQGGLLQRRTLNMPESTVRMMRAFVFAMATWANFIVKQKEPHNKIPVVLLVQLATNLLTWAAHWCVAGPARDRLIRDEQLKVDIATRGPELLRGLASRTGVTDPANITADSITEVDEEAIQTLLAMAKDRKVVQMEGAVKLFRAEEHQVIEQLTVLLNPNGTATAAKLSVPQVKEYFTSVRHKAEDGRTLAETALAGRVEARVQELGLHRAEDGHYARHLQELQSINADVARLAHPDQWVDIATSRKWVLEAVMVDAPSRMSTSRIMQYLFEGIRSTDDMVRTAHLLAQDIRTDWRRFSPDLQYKLGKAGQVAFMGSSTIPFVISSAFAVAEAKGHSIPLPLRILLSAGPFGLYLLGERYSGELVNAVIQRRQEMQLEHPFGREPSASRRAEDVNAFLKNSVLVLKAAKEDLQRGHGTQKAQKLITTAQALERPE